MDRDRPADDEEKAVLARVGADKKWPKSEKWTVTYKGRETVGDESVRVSVCEAEACG